MVLSYMSMSIFQEKLSGLRHAIRRAPNPLALPRLRSYSSKAEWGAVMTGEYFTRATKLNGLAQLGMERGEDISELLRASGIDPAVLKHPETAIDYGDFCRLLHRCALAWDLPDLGIRMVRHQAIDFLGPVALVTRMEATVRDAIRAIISNLVLHANATVALLDEDGDTASLILNRRADAPDGRENTELVMAQGKLVLDSVATENVKLLEVSFMHDQGASAKAVSAHFGCPIRYGAQRCALSFDGAILDRPTEKTDTAFHALIKRYFASAHDERRGSTIEMVRSEIARQMEFGQCTLPNVAQALKTSPRNLQRGLHADGTSFRDLVDEWRRNRALVLVTNTRLPLSEVSNALGYSEQSVFSQAFRRWYGDAPLGYRSTQMGAGAARRAVSP